MYDGIVHGFIFLRNEIRTTKKVMKNRHHQNGMNCKKEVLTAKCDQNDSMPG